MAGYGGGPGPANNNQPLEFGNRLGNAPAVSSSKSTVFCSSSYLHELTHLLGFILACCPDGTGFVERGNSVKERHANPDNRWTNNSGWGVTPGMKVPNLSLPYFTLPYLTLL